jgi:hypothetical protein
VGGTITFTDPCVNLFTFAATTQATLPDYEYALDGTDAVFTLNKFTVLPLVCIDMVTYECTNVVGPNGADFKKIFCPQDAFDGIFNGDSTDGLLTVSATHFEYSSGSVPAGTYTFTITATTAGGDQLTTDFTWTLIDPCGPPEFVLLETMPDKTYTIFSND